MLPPYTFRYIRGTLICHPPSPTAMMIIIFGSTILPRVGGEGSYGGFHVFPTVLDVSLDQGSKVGIIPVAVYVNPSYVFGDWRIGYWCDLGPNRLTVS